MPDPTSHICFRSVFAKTAWIILCKTDPDPIWMVWWGFGQIHFVWNQAGVQESSGLVSGRTQSASYQFPRFQTRFRSFTEVPDNIVPNQPGYDLVLADCASFGSNGFGPKASQCARITQLASGQCFPADPDRKWFGSGMFIGQVPVVSSYTGYKQVPKHLLLYIDRMLDSWLNQHTRELISARNT